MGEEEGTPVVEAVAAAATAVGSGSTSSAVAAAAVVAVPRPEGRGPVPHRGRGSRPTREKEEYTVSPAVVVDSRRPPRRIKDLNPLDHQAQVAAAAAGEGALSLCGSLESKGASEEPVAKNEVVTERRLVGGG